MRKGRLIMEKNESGEFTIKASLTSEEEEAAMDQALAAGPGFEEGEEDCNHDGFYYLDDLDARGLERRRHRNTMRMMELLQENIACDMRLVDLLHPPKH